MKRSLWLAPALLAAAVCPGCGILGDYATLELDDAAWMAVAPAERQLERGEPEQALITLAPLLQAEPASFRARRARQEALIALGRDDEALRLSELEERERGDADSMVLLARLLDDRSARVELSSALRLDPDHAWAWFGRAVLTVRDGDVNAALLEVTTSLEKPGAPAEALRLRADLRDRLGDFAGSADDYREYLRHRPADDAARFNLAAILHRELDDARSAEPLYRELLEREDQHSGATVGLAVRATEAGDFAAAERLYLSICDREPIALFNLALLYADHLGKLVEAKECLKRFIAFEGDVAFGSDRLLYAPLLLEEIERRMAESESP